MFNFFLLAESPKEKSGGLAFDVILKPAAVDNVPILKAISTPNKEISQEIIEKKLKEADERRMVESYILKIIL